jgi:hypothetical protein
MSIELDPTSDARSELDEYELLTSAEAAPMFKWGCSETLRKRWKAGRFPPPLNPKGNPQLWDKRVLVAWAAHVARTHRDNYQHWAESVSGSALLKQVAADYAALTAQDSRPGQRKQECSRDCS